MQNLGQSGNVPSICKPKLLADIRNHLAVLNPAQRDRLGAVLLREAADAIAAPTLTDAEREAIVTALAFLREEADEPGVAQDAATLRGLLERTA